MKSAFARLSSLRPGKTWIALGAALAIGVAAALAARSYLNRQMAAMEALNRSEVQQLLVAKRDLRKGETMSIQTLAVRAVPKEYVHSSAITSGEFAHIKGRTLEHGMQQGDMLLWSLLEGEKVPTFSARVEVGRRAITVQVDEINSISGLLEPGDAIDLMLTLDRKGRKTTVPLLQNVRIMATGQRSVDDPRSGERRQYSTVTLDTSQAEAQSVIAAREAGKITALLRNPKDMQVAETDSAALAALLGMADDMQVLADASDATARAVPVLYGGNRAGFKPDDLTLRPSRQSPVPLTQAGPRFLAGAPPDGEAPTAGPPTAGPPNGDTPASAAAVPAALPQEPTPALH